MRLHPDDLGRVTRVEWYEVPDNRKIMPYATPFRSRDWESASDPPLLGEILGPGGERQYFAGDLDDLTTGERFCGSREQWENGPSVLDLAGKKDPNTGLPCCCSRGVIASSPGLVLGADVDLQAYAGTSGCSHFVFQPYSKYWEFTFSSGVPNGLCFGTPPILGKHIIHESSPGECRFEAFEPSGAVWLMNFDDPTNKWYLRQLGGSGTTLTYRARGSGSLSGWANALFDRVPGSDFCYTGAPPSIIVGPALPP